MFSFRWRLLPCAALALSSRLAAQPPLTTIQDVLYTADGNRFSGAVSFTWKSFEASDTSGIAAAVTRIEVENGNLYVQLVPTTNANPPASYSVQYNGVHRVQFAETWVVPPSTGSLRVRDVRLPPGAVTTQGPPPVTVVQISDVVGLQSALNLRPTVGAGFSIAHAAVINASGSLDGALGNLSDCVHVDGTSGPCGSAVNTSFVDAETPAGIEDGVNAVFTLSNTPAPASSLTVFRNGLLLRQAGDFAVSGNTLSFQAGAVPQAADVIVVSYRVGTALPGVGFIDGETPSGSVDGVNTLFTLSQAPNPASSLAVFRNGLRLKAGLDYTAATSSIAFVANYVPQSGDVLLCSYRVAQ